MNREPTLILTLVGQVISLLVAFGFQLDSVQVVALNGTAAAVVAVLIRRSVTPVKSARVLDDEIVTSH